ncbi:hypothetical protein AB0L14_19405 [Streptomyces sp. NPDC052727]|uniref:hypothetical protein n=1 Tax=Streptomyces sp. NPDC052727 TaxID=3154854 RepID=UPI0034407B60
MLVHHLDRGPQLLAADVVEVDVDAVGRGLAKPVQDGPSWWSKAASEPSRPVRRATFAAEPALPNARG